jgi:hypothetical protein
MEGAASLHFPEMPVNYPAVVGVKPLLIELV